MVTDSYLVETKKDPYEIFKEHAEQFDTRDYDKDHECYSLVNKKEIELNGVPIEEY